MSRDERAQELQRLMLSNPDEFFALYRKALGLSERASIPITTPLAELVKTILDREFSTA